MTDWQMIKLAISIIIMIFGMVLGGNWWFIGFCLMIMTATGDKKKKSARPRKA